LRAAPLIALVLAWAAPAFAQQPGVTSAPDHVGRALAELLVKDDERTARSRDLLLRQDVQSYEIDACIDPDRRSISADCAITVRSTTDRLVLALNDGLGSVSVLGPAGSPLAFVRGPGSLEIRLGRVPAEPVKVVVRYQGRLAPGPEVCAGRGLLFLGAGSRWYPVADAMDPATMRLTIRYPDGYSSVCTGKLVGMAPPAAARRCRVGDVWESERPLSSAAVVVGSLGSSFGVWGDVFLGYHWYVPASGDTVLGKWAPDVPPGPAVELKGLVSYLEACYGPYPYDWLNVILLPPNLEGFEAASSAAGLIVVQDLDHLGLSGGSSALARCSLELARSWWSFSVDAGALVSDGLAAAAEVGWFEATGGDENALRRRDFRRSQYARALADSGGSASLSECLGCNPSADRRVCRGKGSALFDILDRLVGRDAYCRALALFAERHRGRTASLRDLVAAFEESSGQDLDWFFYEWVYRGDLPTYAVEYTAVRQRNGRYRVTGTVRQDGEIYRTPIPLTVDLGTWSYDEVVSIESSEQPFEFMADSQPLRIFVDGDHLIPMIESRERARMHFDRGNAARAENDWSEAVDEYGAAVFLEPKRASYRYAYGEALVRAGRLTTGLEALEAAVRLDPKNPEQRLWIAQLYIKASGYTSALRHLDAYVAMRRDDPDGESTRALALLGLRRFEEARASIETARVLVARSGSQPSALEKLYVASGRYHEAIGNPAAAIDDYERALRANPVSDEARKRLAELKARTQ